MKNNAYLFVFVVFWYYMTNGITNVRKHEYSNTANP